MNRTQSPKYRRSGRTWTFRAHWDPLPQHPRYTAAHTAAEPAAAEREVVKVVRAAAEWVVVRAAIEHTAAVPAESSHTAAASVWARSAAVPVEVEAVPVEAAQAAAAEPAVHTAVEPVAAVEPAVHTEAEPVAVVELAVHIAAVRADWQNKDSAVRVHRLPAWFGSQPQLRIQRKPYR